MICNFHGYTQCILSTVIFIRFERLAYTFLEPEFEVEDGEEVFLVKDGITELTYYILLQRREEDPPTFNIDYFTNLRASGFIVTFPADEQRLQIFGEGGASTLILFPDSLPEGPESFQISSDPTGNPTYQRPATGGVTTLIIEDDDSMYGSYYMYSIIKLALFFAYRHHSLLSLCLSLSISLQPFLSSVDALVMQDAQTLFLV